ncbi:MAG: GWxTD domain-containing protein [Candidatus Eisenbacteria bacterium]|nr:GWxTD domain-containing protein [Candidatus Eisenbacteria bacterium]
MLSLAAACALVSVARSEEMRAEGPPPWRVGGTVGFTLDATTRPDSSGLVLDVAVRIPPATLMQLERDADGVARLVASAAVKGRFGSSTLESQTEVVLSASDTVRSQGKVVYLHFPAAPGPCRITVKLTDAVSHRPALFRSSKDAHESVAIRGEIEIPRASSGRDLSDPQFLWPTVDGREGLAFVRAGRTCVPNPDRLYGLYATDLRAAFVARSKPGDERAWHWVARVYDARGEGVAQAESTGAVGRMLDAEVRFDLSSEPAGAYDLEVKAWQEGDANALMRRARFSVGWQSDTWLRNAADVMDDAHFLLDADGEEAFLVTPPGEQERVMSEFWAKRDPTPETAINESLIEFRERVKYANENFTKLGVEKGMYTDMGRVYIRYGAPSEITHQVIPAGSETLTQQLEQIVVTEDRALGGDVRMKGLGGDMRPFEVWVYEGDIPLPLDADPADKSRGRVRRRMMFLFVDDQGLGLYRLRYSTE